MEIETADEQYSILLLFYEKCAMHVHSFDSTFYGKETPQKMSANPQQIESNIHNLNHKSYTEVGWQPDEAYTFFPHSKTDALGFGVQKSTPLFVTASNAFAVSGECLM